MLSEIEFADLTAVNPVVVLILDARQKRAVELKQLTDRSGSMSEEQLTELRADIKVSETSRIPLLPFRLV